MLNYAISSIETHLFFARIMQEHVLFLQAGFTCKETTWIQKADFFREQFKTLLHDVVQIGDSRVQECVIKSDELVTEFTIPAEKRTSHLTGISIDSSISEKEHGLHAYCGRMENRNLPRIVHQINIRSIRLLNGLIEFKESILNEVNNGNLYNANYPMLIHHTVQEAKLYRSTIQELMTNRSATYTKSPGAESFWNHIMMEHALFSRGLLDPSEAELIDTANAFAENYKELLEEAKQQECQAITLTQKSLDETIKYRDFKALGADGILHCKIAGLILPLFADHLLREANHYIRLLTCNCKE